MFLAADRVLETSTTVGTGPLALLGAAVSYQSFAHGVGIGNQTYYAAVATNDYEVGIGTVSADGLSLSRDTVLSSSNAGALVNFPAGTKTVFNDYPAPKSVYIMPSGLLNVDMGYLTGTKVEFNTACSDGDFVFVGDIIPAANISGGQPVTAVSDANVTLTLGGSPAIALLDPVSFTVGWSGQLPVSRGGTGAASLTGYLYGNGTGAMTASPTIPASAIGAGQPATQVNDTNVTLTLSGSPATALLAPTAFTMGWTGQLSVARGGTGAATLTGYLKGNGTGPLTGQATIPVSDVTGAVAEAPNDGQQYARQSLGWSVVVPAVPEAPTDGKLYSRRGSDHTWQPSTLANFQKTEIIATAGQTVFTPTYPYAIGYLDVSVNGVKLATAEYTATNGTTVTLATPVQVNDVVVLEGFTAAAISNEMTAQRVQIIATAGQTTFQTTYPYVVGFLGVYSNGVRLATSEFTATDGVNVVLTTPASVGDTILLEGFLGSALSGPAVGTMAQYNNACTDGDFVYTANASPLTSGSVAFAGAGGLLTQDNTHFFWDSTNRGLSVGSQGGESGVNWVGMFRRDQNASSRVAVLNNTVGGAAGAIFHITTGTANSYAAYGTYENNGAPYHELTMGSALSGWQITASGQIRHKTQYNGKSIIFSNVIVANPANLDVGEVFTINADTPANGLTFSSGDARFMTFGVTTDNYAYMRAVGIALNTTTDISFRPGGAELMHLGAGGHVVINNGSTFIDGNALLNVYSANMPQYALAVKNNTTSNAFQAVFFNPNGPVGSIQTTGTSTAYLTTSDVRLKTNIFDSEDSGALIDALKVRQFDWIADGAHQRFGFIAQEVDEVFPEAVAQPLPGSDIDVWSMDNSKLVPLLLKEIQSLRARLAAAGIA